jgi:hypothetical protein
VVQGLSKKKNQRKNKNKTQTHTHTHTHTHSSCRQNIALFGEKGDNYFAYSSSTKKRWKYSWQHCVTVHKIIIGGIFNALNYMWWQAS